MEDYAHIEKIALFLKDKENYKNLILPNSSNLANCNNVFILPTKLKSFIKSKFTGFCY